MTGRQQPQIETVGWIESTNTIDAKSLGHDIIAKMKGNPNMTCYVPSKPARIFYEPL